DRLDRRIVTAWPGKHDQADTLFGGPSNALVYAQRTRHYSRVRILVATDLHYRLPLYDWLVRQAAEVDVVAITGDLADISNPVPLDVQIVVLDRYLELLAEQAVVVVASGNHDLDGPGNHGEQVAGWLRRP